MKTKTATENLLDDVFESAVSVEKVRGLARRRRWTRRGRQAAVAGPLILVACLFIREKPKVTPAPLASRPVIEMVSSRPLAADFQVQTTGGGYTTIDSVATSQLTIKTNPNTLSLELLDDAHLLEFVPGALLVQHQGSKAELVLPQPRPPWAE